MSKIRKNDEVIVIAGKDKGKRGKVLKVFLKTGRVLVEHVNLIKKHVKPNPQLNTSGGVISKEASLDISNVALFNAVEKKQAKVGYKVLGDGRKVRCFKSTGELVDL